MGMGGSGVEVGVEGDGAAVMVGVGGSDVGVGTVGSGSGAMNTVSRAVSERFPTELTACTSTECVPSLASNENAKASE